MGSRINEVRVIDLVIQRHAVSHAMHAIRHIVRRVQAGMQGGKQTGSRVRIERRKLTAHVVHFLAFIADVLIVLQHHRHRTCAVEGVNGVGDMLPEYSGRLIGA